MREKTLEDVGEMVKAEQKQAKTEQSRLTEGHSR